VRRDRNPRGRRCSPQVRRPSRARPVVGLVLTLVILTAWQGQGRASSGDGTLEPSGRGVQLLGQREAILLEQSERARRSARARGLRLYRLLAGEPAEQVGAREIALATAVLARDLIEARALRGELDRVRAERASLRDLPDEGLRTGQPKQAETDRPRRWFLQPVAGSLLTPFGVARDPGTGAWIFRAAATYAAHPGETVSSPTAARVMRVASSVAGGAAVVLAEEPGSGWTSVVSGLASVAVAPGELVGRGDPLGRVDEGAPGAVRVEIWRGRTPIDPASVLRGK